MDQIFNLNRFLSYEKRDLYRSAKHFISILGIIWGIYIVSLIIGYSGNWLMAETLIRLIPVVGTIIIIFAPCFLEESRNKKTIIFSYILPVSTWEHFLTIFLKYVIIIPFICISSIYLFLQLIEIIGVIEKMPFYKYVNNTDHLKDYKSFLIIYSTQSIYIFGYFYFKKHTIFKTSTFIIASLIILPYFAQLIIKITTGETIYLDAFKLLLPLDYVKKFISTSSIIIIITGTIMKIIFPFGIWVLTYFKLRETEI